MATAKHRKVCGDLPPPTDDKSCDWKLT
jgi:hypothetical protein